MFHAPISKKLTIVLAIAAMLVFIGISTYRFLLPRVTVVNQSEFPVQAVTVRLPGSRVTFSAVEPGGISTVYYSPQERDGNLNYSVHLNDVTHEGSLPYSGSGQYRRVVRVRIDDKGFVTVKQSN